ncbi:MAG: phospholipid carrier-dependent glycosyltransferase, partial [Lachnospiraceae bacterium]
MMPVFYEIGIFSFVGMLIFGFRLLQKKNGKPFCYHPAEIGVIYFFAHIFPVLMEEERDLTRLRFLWVDLVFLVLAYLTYRNEQKKKEVFPLFVFYLINPAITVGLLSQNMGGQLVVVIAAVLICFVGIRIPLSYLSLFYWILIPLSFWGYIEITQMEIPHLFVIELTLSAVAVAVNCGVYIYLRMNSPDYFMKNPMTVSDGKASDSEDKSQGIRAKSPKKIGRGSASQSQKKAGRGSASKSQKKADRGSALKSQKKAGRGSALKSPKKQPLWTRWDTLVVSILTILCGFLIFWRLGSHQAPETEYYFELNNNAGNELILDLGAEYELSEIVIYLGKLDNRLFSFSYFDEQTGQWVLVKENENVSSVFCWNRISCPMRVRFLGVVSMYEEAYVNEMILLDVQGNVITPVNAGVYASLFDEQDKFPGNATYYDQTMFDEIYHARTAYEILNGDNIYEYTHPQLGKILMGIGITMFGMTPFGWRFVCAVMGLLLVPLMYFLVRQVTKKTWISMVITLFLIFDFMHLTLSRIGTLDIIIAVWVVAMFTAMYVSLRKMEQNAPLIENPATDSVLRKKLLRQEILLLFVTGVLTGLAIATKWTGLYAAAGLAICIFLYLLEHYPKPENWKKAKTHLIILFFTCVVAFLLIPFIFYVLSFYPFWKMNPDKNIFVLVYEMSVNMYQYHKGITETHPYMSYWYEWLWNKQPLLDAITVFDDGKVSSVATFGNPLVWFVGSVAVVVNAILWRCKKDRNAGFFCIAYLSMLIPWLLVYRTVFIYQYFCSVLMF